MSTHPNSILMLTLQPHDLPRKTLRAIAEEACKKNNCTIHEIAITANYW